MSDVHLLYEKTRLTRSLARDCAADFLRAQGWELIESTHPHDPYWASPTGGHHIEELAVQWALRDYEETLGVPPDEVT